jgi:hypothetical protein
VIHCAKFQKGIGFWNSNFSHKRALLAQKNHGFLNPWRHNLHNLTFQKPIPFRKISLQSVLGKYLQLIILQQWNEINNQNSQEPAMRGMLPFISPRQTAR